MGELDEYIHKKKEMKELTLILNEWKKKNKVWLDSRL